MPTDAMPEAMPQELLDESRALDAANEDMMSSSPPVSAKAKEIKLIVAAINSVLALIPGSTQIAPEVRDYEQEPLPSEIVKALFMINEAAKQLMDGFELSLDSLSNPGGVEGVAFEIQTLAKDKDFKAGLSKPAAAGAEPPAAEGSEGMGRTKAGKKNGGKGKMSEQDASAMLMSRMQ